MIASCKQMDHIRYASKVKRMSEESLRFTITDARAAIAAFPENQNAGFYADEICYCSAELRRRSALK